MKNVLAISILLCFCISCNTRKYREQSLSTSKVSDFIVDSTLMRAYLDDTLSFETRRMPDCWSGEVLTADVAFQIAEREMYSVWSKEDIDSQKPFSINLIDNKIWIIEGTSHQSKDEDFVFGWVSYIEISKDSGEILRVIQTE